MKALRALLKRSIRAKIMFLIYTAIIVSILSIGIISILSIRTEDETSARQQLTLISRSEQMGIDDYLNSIRQSVDTVSRFASDDLNREGDTDLNGHLERVANVFQSIAGNTNGAMTYYYRIETEEPGGYTGFWYVNQNGKEYVREAVTDVSAYNASDMTHVGWYTTAKREGVPVWLPPYYNANLGVEMISYVEPVYRHGVFFGVVGMDFRFSTLEERVADIALFRTGYAFLTDADGTVICHPSLTRGTLLSTVDESLVWDRRGHQEEIICYTLNGEKLRAAWAKLENGMLLYVTAPESEITAGWTQLTCIIIEAVACLLAVFFPVTTEIVRRTTDPLRRLTDAAVQMDAGDYNVELDYTGEDEVGILTGAFRQLVGHLQAYIQDLNSRAYTDSLTSVRNKGAYVLFARKLQDQMSLAGEMPPEFAICMFDCNDLKLTNDTYGHDKGDIYLKAACSLICRVFRHSPVFRVGGDEFVAVLKGEDYNNRKDLLERFDSRAAEISSKAENPWERVDVAKGIAEYDPVLDNGVDDVLRRADELMYQAKRRMKAERNEGGRSE